MITTVKTKLENRAAKWRAEANDRRTRTANDPGADALESCAKDLELTAKELADEVATLTPEGYGELHGVTPQTVRNWCRAGHVAGAEHGPGGWRIPLDAKPPTLRKTG